MANKRSVNSENWTIGPQVYEIKKDKAYLSFCALLQGHRTKFHRLREKELKAKDVFINDAIKKAMSRYLFPTGLYLGAKVVYRGTKEHFVKNVPRVLKTKEYNYIKNLFLNAENETDLSRAKNLIAERYRFTKKDAGATISTFFEDLYRVETPRTFANQLAPAFFIEYYHSETAALISDIDHYDFNEVLVWSVDNGYANIRKRKDAVSDFANFLAYGLLPKEKRTNQNADKKIMKDCHDLASSVYLSFITAMKKKRFSTDVRIDDDTQELLWCFK